MLPDYVEFVSLSASSLVGETSRYSVQALNVIQFLSGTAEFYFITSIFFSGVQPTTLRIDGISMNLLMICLLILPEAHLRKTPVIPVSHELYFDFHENNLQ